MRRPLHLKQAATTASQQGYALFIVLMIMIVIALLVVAATQSYNTEQRISTNDADRKMAATLAEAALREGENSILDFAGNTITFSEDCQNGRCRAKDATVPAGISNIVLSGNNPSDEAWKRTCGSKPCIDEGIEYKNFNKSSNTASKAPRYIIEYISSTPSDGKTIYRVTAKAWGKNENTVVVLQSYVANE